MLPHALRGIRVIEWSEGIAGPFCARLLAEMGAEVVKIEAPNQGNVVRAWPPFHERTDGGQAGPSGLFFYYNVGKKGITLRPETDRGGSLFRELVRGADVLIEDRPPGFMEDRGLGYATLSAINPGLVMTSITPFGQTGPYRGYKSYQLNNLHAGGEGWELVQRSGVAAVPSFNAAQLFGDSHLEERSAWVHFEHPVQGPRHDLRLPWVFSDGHGVYGPAPLMGQHNGRIYGDLLGIRSDEIAALEQDEIVY